MEKDAIYVLGHVCM